MKYVWTVPLIAAALVGGVVSCGGGGKSATPTATPAPPAVRTTGFAVPTEVTPVSTGTASKAAARTGGFSGALAALASSIQPEAYSDAGTDYSTAATVRFVSEQSIDQFSIIETILNAINQTHYADAANVGAGPYKSIVSWQQNNQGNQGVDIQTWIVDSSIITVNAQPVNQVNAWIEDSGQLIRAQFKISASANQAADGSYLDYGVWTLQVKFDAADTLYFTAKATVDATGAAVVALSQSQQNGGGGGTNVVKAVLHKSPTSGYGKVNYPNQGNNGASVQTTASYVYDANQLLVHQTVPAPATLTYQDRTTSVPITAQYGLYDAVTGVDVMKTHHFGFPVGFTLQGVSQYGFYGANQGADQLWINSGATIPDGTTVTRQDQGANGLSYQTVSFNGMLVKRTYVAGTINDLLNIPVQTNINFQHALTWNGTAWMENGAAFTDFASLVSAPQKSVWINAMHSGGGGMPMTLVYDPSNASGAGFYPGTMSSGSTVETPGGSKYVPASGDMMWININGSIYIEYTGATTGWVQKKVTSFDQNTWTPTFDPNGDTAFTLGLNTQYSINNQGGNFVVTETALSPASYTVQMEVQTPVNPVNAATVAGGIATFRPQNYQTGQSSTYQFVTDATSAKYLMLVYQTVGTQDSNANPAPKVGDVVSQGQWSMEAYGPTGVDLGLQYDWNYPQGNGNYGTQTFLYSTSGSTRTYTLLDNPIQLAPLTLTQNGASRTLSLQYNGWMSGLPDYASALAMNGGIISAAIAEKVVNIPAGTVVTDQNDSTKSYVIKPLQIGLYLPSAAIPDTSLDITAADALNLADPSVIPVPVDNGLGAEPVITTVKYVDGVLQQ